MAHDQFFKELLQAFFRQFLELFFPILAARLDFATVEFLDKEMFTDFPAGAVREADLVARVRTREGEAELILVHIEVQSRRARNFGARMFEYYMLLRLRHQLPVLPIVLYLERGAGGLGRDQYRESVLNEPVLTFDYHRIGVRDLEAGEYLERENPLAPALASLMKTGEQHAAEVKVQALLRVAQALVNEAQRMLLANCVEIYLPLSQSEQQLFDDLTRQSDYREVTEMKSIYEIQGEARGEARGRALGERKAALFLLQQKFGELPEFVEKRVQMMESEAEINALLAGILQAQSLNELNLTDETTNEVTAADEAANEVS